MPLEADDNLHLEIGHVLFIDIVGYSKLLKQETEGAAQPIDGIRIVLSPREPQWPRPPTLFSQVAVEG